MCKSVVIDDDVFTVTESTLRSEHAEIRALPLSDLIEAKRSTGLYDADFEERIANILTEEERMEAVRKNEFLSSIHAIASEPCSQPNLVSPEDLRRFNEILTKIIRFKRRIDSVKSKRPSKDHYYQWKYVIEELKSKVWSLVGELHQIELNPTNSEVRKLLIIDMKKMICAHYHVPFNHGEFPATMVATGTGARLFEPSIFEKEMDEYHAVLDYFVRLSKHYYGVRSTLVTNPSSGTYGEIDVDEPVVLLDSCPQDPPSTSVVNAMDAVDTLADALGPLAIEGDEARAAYWANTGAIPKRRRHHD